MLFSGFIQLNTDKIWTKEFRLMKKRMVCVLTHDFEAKVHVRVCKLQAWDYVGV